MLQVNANASPGFPGGLSIILPVPLPLMRRAICSTLENLPAWIAHSYLQFVFSYLSLAFNFSCSDFRLVSVFILFSFEKEEIPNGHIHKQRDTYWSCNERSGAGAGDPNNKQEPWVFVSFCLPLSLLSMACFLFPRCSTHVGVRGQETQMERAFCLKNKILIFILNIS